MTYAPANIKAAAAYWVAHGGLNGGIVGDAAHRARPSYHNGKDAIDAYGRTAANDYTIRTARDIAGLTLAASALDLSWPAADKAPLRGFSVWLVDQCYRKAPDTDDIREVIYTPDGKVVLRWNDTEPEDVLGDPNEADSSHLWHTHISWYRDATKVGRDLLGPFRRYFEGEDIIVDPRTLVPLALCDVAPGGTVYADPGRVKVLIPSWAGGTGVGLYADAAVPAATPPPLVPIRVDFGTGGSDIRLVWVGRDKVSNIRPVADSTPYDQEDIDAAIAADRALARVTWDA